MDRADQLMNQFQRNADNAARSASNLGRRIGEIAGGVTAANVLERIIDQLKSFAVESAKLGREAKIQEDAFARLTESVGVSGDALIKKLEEVSGGTVNTSDIMIAAARNLQDAFEPQEIVKLMEIARQQAKIAGKDVQTTFNMISESIANANERGLRGAKINIDLEAATKKYAAQLGVTATELTEAAKQQAIFNAVVEQTAPLVAALTTEGRTQEEQMQRWAAQWKQLKEDIGKFLVDAGFKVAMWIQDVLDQIAEMGPELESLSRVWTQTWTGALTVIQPVSEFLGARIAPTVRELTFLFNTLGVGIQAAVAALAGPLAYLSSILDDLAKGRWQGAHTKALAEMKVAAGEALNSLQKMIDAQAGGRTGARNQAQGLEALAESARNLAKEYSATGKASDMGTNRLRANRREVQAAEANFDSLARAMRALSEQSEIGGLSESEAELRNLTRSMREAIETTKGLSPQVAQFYRNWADGIARTIILQKELAVTTKEAMTAVNQVTESGFAQDLLDDAKAWSEFSIAADAAAEKARIAGDATGGIADQVRLAEELVFKLSMRFGTMSAQAGAARDRLDELQRVQSQFTGFASVMEHMAESTDAAVEALQDEMNIWAQFSQNLEQVRVKFIDMNDEQGRLEEQLKVAQAAVQTMAARFGEGSVQADLMRQRVQELRTELEALAAREWVPPEAETDMQRVADVWARLGVEINRNRLEFLATGDAMGRVRADIAATTNAFIEASLRLGETSEEAKKLKERLEGLKMEERVRDVFSSIGQTVSTSLQGVIAGTQTLSKAVENMAQSFIVGFADKVIRQALKPVEDALADLTVKAIKLAGELLLTGFGGGAAAPAAGAGAGAASGVDLYGMAKGGVVSKPTLALIGEAGPEAVIPLGKIPRLARGGIVQRPTIAMVGEEGGEVVLPLNRLAPPETEVNIYAPPGAQVSERQRDSGDMKKVRDVFISMVNQAGANGDLDKMLGGRYNLKPSVIRR